jgi:transcriptional regulator
MYLPKHYEETRLEVLHQLMQAHPLATIITLGGDGINANHIPLHLDAAASQFGTLRGHVARANPLWQTTPLVETLVIFHGPNAYVSPQWNPVKKQTGKTVPTWNYAVVHCYGTLRVLDTPLAARRNVDELSATHEAALPPPWTLDEAPPDYTEKMLAAIVGIELEITKITGKWKMSQNHPAASQQGTVLGLRQQAGFEAHQVADLVAAHIKPASPKPD